MGNPQLERLAVMVNDNGEVSIKTDFKTKKDAEDFVNDEMIEKNEFNYCASIEGVMSTYGTFHIMTGVFLEDYVSFTVKHEE